MAGLEGALHLSRVTDPKARGGGSEETGWEVKEALPWHQLPLPNFLPRAWATLGVVINVLLRDYANR